MIKDVDFEEYVKYLRQLRAEGFTGKVNVNFYKGEITNVNVGNEPAIWQERSVKIKEEK